MEFFGAPPPWFSRALMGDISWNVFGEGEIDGESGLRLERFLMENEVPWGSTLCLHSPGGSLDGGIILGRVIREHKLHTHIGQKGAWQSSGYWKAEPGECMSAAAIAFLGGEFRFVGKDSKFGVHQFSLRDDKHNVAEAQIRSATLIDYIRSMEIDTELFTLAAETPSDDIFVVPEETLLRLNVINNGRKRPKWTIESQPTFLYLKGEQETSNGMNKFLIVFPAHGDVVLHVIFDAGVNADDVMNMQSDRLVVDLEYIPVHEQRQARINDYSKINAVYHLQPHLIEKILGAKQVGLILQFEEDAAIFHGFDSMPFEEGAKLLPGLLAVYQRNVAPQGK
jgi:hypothetical protein